MRQTIAKESSMDVAIPHAAKARRRRRLAYSVSAFVVLVGVTVGLSRLKPAAPQVERAQVWVDAVKLGDMVCQVRGTGTLVPETVLWIPTVVAGRVHRILVLPGTAVRADTVLVELSNPEVEQESFNAEWQLKAAEAELANLKVQLQSQQLTQEAMVANAQSAANSARLEADVNEALSTNGLVPQITLRQSRSKASDTIKVLQIETQRLKISADAARAQEAVQQAKVEQLRAELALKRQHAESLKVRAGIDGVLQKLGDTAGLQEGQQLAAGTLVARVADPTHLKAEVKIHETQARDVQLGQLVSIDTRNGTVTGKVVRVDSAVQNGTVTVDVRMEEPLPKGARPDLSVEGTIEIERLAKVLYVGRPVTAEAGAVALLFKLSPNGKEAISTRVKLGRGSVNTIEVLEGLHAGDQIILSDMSQWQTHERIRLN
jgi:HlyD family secretion protein